ncbi:alginate O-acetyltransferase AlgX-related protein [Palleronia sp. KMU-117]|uniref:alginate O-acetyltransferase AlgX-related protein n=1 Tax=Palleronia sp. KMU-117 TaxID=3434108 RepID=UPI003D73ED8F
MTRTLALAAACLLAGLPSIAQPYCEDFLSEETLPAKYRSLFPIVSDAGTGWIFTGDQLDAEYDLKPEALALVGQIVTAFADQGVPLAILMPPPRPSIAGQAAFDATAGGRVGLDVEAADASFSRMVQQVAQTGAIMPDLRAAMTRDEGLRGAYYFRRDTHWTPTGVVASALVMAEAVAQRHPDLFPNAGTVLPSFPADVEMLDEPGSLSDVAEDVCGLRPEPEVAAVPVFPASGLGLLDGAASMPRIALVGTSFSDRRRRDYYRVADAMAGAFQADVDNFSVSGGGSASAMEVFALSGAFLRAEHDLVIWELPYTENLSSISTLRQVLGALDLARSQPGGAAMSLDRTGRMVLPLGGGDPDLVVVKTPGGTPDYVTIDVRFEDGSATSLTLRRKGDFPPDLSSAEASLSVSDQGKDIAEIEARYDIASTGTQATIELRSLR